MINVCRNFFIICNKRSGIHNLRSTSGKAFTVLQHGFFILPPPHKPSFLQCILWSRNSGRTNVPLSISVQENQFQQSLRRSIVKCQPKILKFYDGLWHTDFKFNFKTQEPPRNILIVNLSSGNSILIEPLA